LPGSTGKAVYRTMIHTSNPGEKSTDQRHPWLSGTDTAALAAFGVIAAGALGISLVESYSNLLAYFLTHGLHGWRAAIAPGGVDTFIVLGELLLFVSMVRSWPGWAVAIGIAFAALGFMMSVGGNIWHSASSSLADHFVSAIWPVTATIGIAGGLVIIKLVTAEYQESVATAGRTAGSPVEPPHEPADDTPSPANSSGEAREPDPAVRRPARGRQPKQIDLTPEMRADLDAGIPGRKLAAKYSQLTPWTAARLVSEYRQSNPHLAEVDGENVLNSSADGETATDGE
jgi:hypothetical protein